MTVTKIKFDDKTTDLLQMARDIEKLKEEMKFEKTAKWIRLSIFLFALLFLIWLK